MALNEICEKIKSALKDNEQGLRQLCAVCPRRSFFITLDVHGMELPAFRINARDEGGLDIRSLALGEEETTKILRSDTAAPPTERELTLACDMVRQVLKIEREVPKAIYNVAQSCPKHSFNLHCRVRGTRVFLAGFWPVPEERMLGAEFADRKYEDEYESFRAD